MLSGRTKNLVPVVAIVLSFFVLGIGNNAHATEECWVDLAAPYGQITVADAHALINGYVALGGFDFDQDGQPEFIDHNGDGVYNSTDVLGIWNEYAHAWINAYYNGCAPVQTEETVPVSGGVVVAEDGGAVVEIPAGALLETTTITVTPLEDGPFTNWGEFEAYEFGPDGTQFQTPVRLSLSYADMGPVDPNTLSIVTYEGGDWVAIPLIDIDYSAQVVIGETTHFSTYALTTAPAAAIGQGCGVAGNQMRLPAWNKDKFLQSNRTCGVNGRGAIVANCSGDWSEVVWTDEDPVTDDHLSSVHADDTRHRCWWRSGGTNKTGEECEIPVPAPDRDEAAPEDWYNVTNPTESFTCYDLDVCVAGATCDSGTCGLIELTETGDERIRVADVNEWTAADLDGAYLKEKYGCVCNEGYVPDGKGGCELRCEPGYKNPGDDVCVLDCPENEAEYGGECVLACALDADPDSLCAANEHCDIANPPGIGICVVDNPCEGYECGAHGSCALDDDVQPFCDCASGWKGAICDEQVIGCTPPHCGQCDVDEDNAVFCTDKTQYAEGEVAKLQVANNLENSIWYIGYPQPELVFWTIEQATGADWSRVDFQVPVTQDGAEVCRIAHYEPPVGEVLELTPNSELLYEWNQKICVFGSPTEETIPELIERGTYRFALHYSFDTVVTENPDAEPWKRPIELGEIMVIYSNEFVLE